MKRVWKRYVWILLGLAPFLFFQNCSENLGNNPASAATPDAYLIMQDQETSGTNAGASAAGTQTRTLNTVVLNTITGASMANSQFTLPPGTYLVEASAPAFYVNRHQAYLYNVTNSAVALSGTSEYEQNLYPVQTRSFIQGVVVLTFATTFQINHYTQTAQPTNGLGVNTGNGQLEVYTMVKVTKLQ